MHNIETQQPVIDAVDRQVRGLTRIRSIPRLVTDSIHGATTRTQHLSPEAYAQRFGETDPKDVSYGNCHQGHTSEELGIAINTRIITDYPDAAVQQLLRVWLHELGHYIGGEARFITPAEAPLRRLFLYPYADPSEYISSLGLASDHEGVFAVYGWGVNYLAVSDNDLKTCRHPFSRGLEEMRARMLGLLLELYVRSEEANKAQSFFQRMGTALKDMNTEMDRLVPDTLPPPVAIKNVWYRDKLALDMLTLSVTGSLSEEKQPNKSVSGIPIPRRTVSGVRNADEMKALIHSLFGCFTNPDPIAGLREFGNCTEVDVNRYMRVFMLYGAIEGGMPAPELLAKANDYTLPAS